jgi:uncharacterized protein YcbK (DUF882 family)
MNLSEHLTDTEFNHSDTAISHNITNVCPDGLLGNAKALATNLFEPIRALLNVPLTVDSGYRCPELNQLVRGVPTSQHLQGQAIDVVPDGMDIHDAFDKIKNSNLVWDQLILEHSGSSIWIHFSYSKGKNRQMVIPNLEKPHSNN